MTQACKPQQISLPSIPTWGKWRSERWVFALQVTSRDFCQVSDYHHCSKLPLSPVSSWGMWKKCKLFIAACLISSLAGKFPSYLEQHWACKSHYRRWLLPWRCSQIEPVPVRRLGQWEGERSSESSEGPDWKVRLLVTGKGGKNNIYCTYIFLSLELFYFIELLWEWI